MLFISTFYAYVYYYTWNVKYMNLITYVIVKNASGALVLK